MSAAAWLLAATWKGSLLIAAVFCIFGLTGRRIPAKWRHALLLLALIRLALPFAPESPFSVFNLAPAVSQTGGGQAPRLSGQAGALRLRSGQAPVLHVAIPIPRPETRGGWNLTTAILAVWASGALLVLVRLAGKTIQLRRRLRLEPPQPIQSDLLDSSRMTLAWSDAVSSPSLLGRTLLLPPQLAKSLTTEQLRFIFLHELAHLRRFDVLVNWFAAVVQALHWFNPLVWIAISRLEEERELACDAVALEHLDRDERSAYGETVIRLLDRLQTPRMIPDLVAMSSTKQQLKRRIQMIASFKNQRGALWSAALVAAFALVTLTDARAGEKRLIRAQREESVEAAESMKRLEQTMTAESRNATLEDILFDVTKSTGMTFKVAEGAFDDRVRNARINMTAKNIPAHMVVNEALASFGLGLEFGAETTIVKLAPHTELFTRALPAPAAGQAKDEVVFIRKSKSTDHEVLRDHESLAPAGGKLRAQAEVNVQEEGGVVRRKVTYRDDDGRTGTLELEVRR